MPFGGLGGVLPLRLGTDSEFGWSAEQHARFCADLVAVSRTAPTFVEGITTGLTGTYTQMATAHDGRNGDGLAKSLSISDAASPNCTVELGKFTNQYGFDINTVEFVRNGWIAIVYSPTFPSRVDLVPGADSATFSFTTSVGLDYVTAIVFGAGPEFNIGDYGGHLLKRNSTTEGNTTYAWLWYQYLRDAQGSAYSTIDTSVRSWELKAQARALGTSQRISEMLAASGTPGSSDAKLGRWAAVLGIQQGIKPRWKIRQDCEQIAQLPEAPTHDYLLAAIGDILAGVATITGIVHPAGTITAWPSGTYWPGIVNGDAAYDLGPGVFSSTRCRMTLQITPVAQGTYSYPLGGSELEYLMSRDVAKFMERTIPATADWDWETGAGAGFILDTSELDLTAL